MLFASLLEHGPFFSSYPVCSDESFQIGGYEPNQLSQAHVRNRSVLDSVVNRSNGYLHAPCRLWYINQRIVGSWLQCHNFNGTMSKESSSLMRKRLTAKDDRLRRRLVSDSEASHVAKECKQVWREMSRKTSPRNYFTTGDIAAYTGLTRRQISKTAKDPGSWLAPFVIGGGRRKHCRFIDPTGVLLGAWCQCKRLALRLPVQKYDRQFRAQMILLREMGDPLHRFLTHRQAAELNPDPDGIFRPLPRAKPKEHKYWK